MYIYIVIFACEPSRKTQSADRYSHEFLENPDWQIELPLKWTN